MKILKKLKNSKTKLAREQHATLTSRQATIINLRNKRDVLIDTLDSKSKEVKELNQELVVAQEEAES